MKEFQRWIRMTEDEIQRAYIFGGKPADEIWQWWKPRYMFGIQIMDLGERHFGKMKQLMLKKLDVFEAQKDMVEAFVNSDEPDYGEKLQIVKKVVNGQNVIAMEVFPAERNLVDVANLYHVWTAEKAKFPFDVIKATELPRNKEWEEEKISGLDIEYMVRTARTEHGKMAYLYLRKKDGKELCWREKQMLKNDLQYDDITAIEIISKHGIGKPTCLMVLPMNYHLDFGLHID